MLRPIDGFLAVTNVRDDEHTVAYGFLRRDGDTRRAWRSGERRVERDRRSTAGSRASRLDARDAAGRELIAVGEPVSRIIINRHTFIDINSLVRWDDRRRDCMGRRSGHVAGASLVG